MHAPWIDEFSFADLDQVAAVDRAVIASSEVVHSPEQRHRRRLAYLLGRATSRPALPDDVDRALQPLQTRALEAREEHLRRLFDEAILAIRVMPEPEYNPDEPSYLTVFFLVAPDWLPDVPPEPFGRTLGQQVHDVARPLVELHDRAEDVDAGRVRGLWDEFLTRLTTALEARLEQHHDWLVAGFALEARTALSQHEFENSDLLDLSHLSIIEDTDSD